MAFATLIDQIATHAAAAGASLSVPITDVAVGWPVPTGRCIRIFWGGEVAPVRMGAVRDFTGELVSEDIVVMAFWPLRDYSVTAARNLVLDMHALTADLRTRILGDSQLGGQSTDLEMAYGQVQFPDLAGAAYVTVEWVITTDFSEYPIAP